MTLPLIFDRSVKFYFLNFFLNPKIPINPEPRRIMVAGSGTAVDSNWKLGPKNPYVTSTNSG